MGFDLFMTVAAIVAAAVATWAILRLFLSENDDIAPSHQRITDDKPAKITPKITPKIQTRQPAQRTEATSPSVSPSQPY